MAQIEQVAQVAHNLPGHSMRVQSSSSELCVGQNAPPCLGAGLSQFLSRVLFPLPHGWLQKVHSSHALQPPATIRTQYNQLFCRSLLLVCQAWFYCLLMCVFCVCLVQWFPTWGPRKGCKGSTDVLRSMGGGPQNDYRGSTVEKGWEPLV